MRIKYTKQPLEQIHGDYTQLSFVEKGVTMLSKERGKETLTSEIGATITHRTFRTAIKAAAQTAKRLKIKRLVIPLDDVLYPNLLKTHGRAWIIETLVQHMLIATYEFDIYKKTKPHQIDECLIAGIKKEDEEAIERGSLVAHYVNEARTLANTPGGDMTPALLARMAQKLAREARVTCTVLNQKQIEKEKMGALLGVSRGSKEEPRFIVLEYWGAGKTGAKKDPKKTNDKYNPIVFVGKGVTFDTGGINLKPSQAVLDMHLDMSGGAAVIATIACAAQLKLKKNLIGLIPAAENMVSGESYRPGDVLTTMAGTTVDVLNTDAEGRLILADALTYAKRYKPRLVVDVATLTGAALAALGTHASALMTKDESVRSFIERYAEDTGDYVWSLPLWDEYKQYTKGVFGDIANVPAHNAAYGGCINGGMFLSHFTKDYTWAHIDMAPRMTSTHGDHLAKGATGEPVRLLIAIASHY